MTTTHLGYTRGPNNPVAQDSISIGVSVPEGRRLFLTRRIITLGEGTFLFELLQPDGGWTGGSPGIKDVLDEGVESAVQSSLEGDVTESGSPTLIYETVISNGGTQGPGNPASVPALDELARSFTSDKIVRITRVTDGPEFVLSIDFYCYERDEDYNEA